MGVRRQSLGLVINSSVAPAALISDLQATGLADHTQDGSMYKSLAQHFLLCTERLAEPMQWHVIHGLQINIQSPAPRHTQTVTTQA